MESGQALDVSRVRTATHYARQYLNEWIINAEHAYTDKQRTERAAAQCCRWCFYGRRSRLAGQAFTTRPCDSCAEDQTFSSTATDPLCMPCAQRLGLCVRCCADVDLTDRVKLERLSKAKR
jgi:hypothetical protein